MQYIIEVTITADTTRYVAKSRTEWLTRYADEVKTFKTEAGAARWIDGRPELNARVVALNTAESLQGARVAASSKRYW